MEDYIKELREALANIEIEKIKKLSQKIEEATKRGSTVFILGNGGSAVNASHMACDLGKGTLDKFYDPFHSRIKVVSLTDNTALMTAIANDIGYEEVFAQQLRNLIKEGDLLIVLTGSGKSTNVLRGIKVAKDVGAYVFSLLGFDGGDVKKISDDYIIVPSKNYGIIEDIHLTIGHLLTVSIKKGNNIVGKDGARISSDLY